MNILKLREDLFLENYSRIKDEYDLELENSEYNYNLEQTKLYVDVVEGIITTESSTLIDYHLKRVGSNLEQEKLEYEMAIVEDLIHKGMNKAEAKIRAKFNSTGKNIKSFIVDKLNQQTDMFLAGLHNATDAISMYRRNIPKNMNTLEELINSIDNKKLSPVSEISVSDLNGLNGYLGMFHALGLNQNNLEDWKYYLELPLELMGKYVEELIVVGEEITTPDKTNDIKITTAKTSIDLFKKMKNISIDTTGKLEAVIIGNPYSPRLLLTGLSVNKNKIKVDVSASKKVDLSSMDPMSIEDIKKLYDVAIKVIKDTNSANKMIGKAEKLLGGKMNANFIIKHGATVTKDEISAIWNSGAKYKTNLNTFMKGMATMQYDIYKLLIKLIKINFK